MRTTIKVFCLFAALALTVTATGCGKTITSAHIRNAITTDQVDSEGNFGTAITSFGPGTTVVYAVAELHNAPENTSIRVVWRYNTLNQVIYETRFDSGNLTNDYLYASLSAGEPFAAGEYQVLFYVEERSEPDVTAHFRIVETATDTINNTSVLPDTSGAYLENVQLTSGYSETGAPLDRLNRVGTTGTWMVSAMLRNTQPNTLLYIGWFTPEQEVLDAFTLDPEGATDVYIGSSLELFEPMPEGTYYVVFLDEGGSDPDEPIAVLEFTVSEKP